MITPVQFQRTLQHLIFACCTAGAASGSTSVCAQTHEPAKANTAATVIDDSVITSKVKAALLGDKEIDSLKVSVTTKRGVVTLSGTAKTNDMLNRIVEHTSKIEGVREVVNLLKIKAD